MNIIHKTSENKPVQKVSTLLRKANKLAKTGLVHEALSIYEKVLTIYPKNSTAIRAIKELNSTNFMPNLIPLIEQKKFDDVENILLNNIQQDEKNPNFWKLLGVVYHEKGDKSLSLQCYQKALELNPTDHDLIFTIGVDFLEVNDVGSAFKTFKLLTSMKPDYSSAYTNIGIIYDKVYKFDKAKQEWLKALKFNSKDTVALTYLGVNAIKNEGTFEKALEYFKSALEIEPNDVNNCVNLAAAYFEMGEVNQALEIYRVWEKLNWSNVSENSKNEFKTNYSLALFCAGHVKDAWKNYSSRIFYKEISPTNLTNLNFPMLENLNDANGKNVILLMEQGLGDQLIFLGLLKSFLDKSNANITLQTETRLEKLFARAFPEIKVTTEIAAEKFEADYWMLCGDLGKVLNFGITSEKLSHPYLNKCLASKSEFGNFIDKHKINVGMAWRSGLIDGRRMQGYTRLGDWQTLIEDPRLNVINLQYGEIDEDLSELTEATKQKFIQPDFDLKNNLETLGCLISMCDVVVGPATAPIAQSMAQGITTLSYGLKGTDRWSFGLGLTENKYTNSWYSNCTHFIFNQMNKKDLVKRIHQEILDF